MMANKIRLLSISAMLSCTVVSLPAMAFDAVSVDVKPTSESGGFVGLGIGYAPDYEGSDDYEAIPAPFGHYRWTSGRYVDLGGASGSEHVGRLSFNIITTDTSSALEFGPLLQYRLERDSVDDKQVDKMENVDAATEAGAFLGISTGPWSVELAFSGDVSDEHDGYLLYLTGKYDIPVNNSFALDVGAHVTYADSNYMEAYFGVDNKNRGNSGLPNYNASDGIKDAGLSMTGLYHFNKTWGMVGSVSWTRMLNDAEDSPLVDGNGGAGDENQFGGVVAVTYSF